MKLNTLSYSPSTSKSIGNRALILAALSEGKSIIRNMPYGEDVDAMMQALKKLGVSIAIQKQSNSRNITLNNKNIQNVKRSKNTIKIDAKNAGTTSRFLLAYAALLNKKIILDGNDALRKRPISDLVDALNKLGAKISYKNNDSQLPVIIYPQIPSGGKVSISMKKTSQYATSLSLIGPFLKEKTIIELCGERHSESYLKSTLELMKLWNIHYVQKSRSIMEFSPLKIIGKEINIPKDIASASYIISIAMLNCTKILVKGIELSKLDAERDFFTYLGLLGCKIQMRPDGLLITPPQTFKALKNVDTQGIPDTTLTLAILCALTQKKTTFYGTSHLQYKESNRLMALSNELKKLGAKVKVGKNTLTIEGVRKIHKNVSIETYGDHRIAMAFSIPKSIYPSITIKNPDIVQKSYTKYWEDYRDTCLNLNKNFILTGMPGSGKTSLGKELAKKWNYKFIDLDHIFESQVKMSIKDYIQENNWEEFRKREAKILKRLKANDRCIISTGGGAILKKENIAILKNLGTVIYLKTRLIDVLKNLKSKSRRNLPYLANGKASSIQKIETQRMPLYTRTSDITLSTNAQTKNSTKDIKQRMEALENQLFYHN